MKSFAKVLTKTDVGANGSHQGGPLIPVGVRGILPQPRGKHNLPSSAIGVKVEVLRDGRFIDTVDASVIAHSRDFNRGDETHFTGSFVSIASAKAGDVMVVGKKSSRRFTVNIIPKRNAKKIKSRLAGKRFGLLS